MRVLALVVLLPAVASCISGDDNDDPTPTDGPPVTSATTLTEPASTETDEPVAMETAGQPSTPTEITELTATTTSEPGEPSPTAEPTATTGPAVPGERPVDLQLSWLLGAINGETPPEEEIEPHLHPLFIAEVPVADFAAIVDQLKLSGPWEFEGYLGEPVELDGIAVISGQGAKLQVLAGLEAEEPNRFLTLLFVPYSSPTLSLDGFEEIDSWLADRVPRFSFQVAEVTGGTCSPIYGVNPDESLAIASTFKLWVLLDLADQIASGERSWNDRLVLSEELKSLPSGTLQAENPGLELGLRTYAAKMIALSDNTATDHLIDLLGREEVEVRFAATGHSSPEQNMPLLLTRELFYLKYAASGDALNEYIAADAEGRRAILESLAIDLDLVDPNQLAIPKALDSVEWFASASDLCGVLADLYEAGQDDGTVREILAASSGVELDRETWPFVGYKGGSEAGVASGAWLLERADGRVFTISVVLNNPDAGIDPQPLASLASAVAGLLASVE